MSLGLLFPGQGSQEVGMGRALASRYPEAAQVFDEADEALGFGLSALMWQGPEEELTRTHNAQPALLTHSTAVWRVLESRMGGEPGFAAGHSLGEYSAHVAAGTLAFADAVALVRLRGELMLAAGDERDGSMAAVLGLSDEGVEALCAAVEDGVCVPANFNSEGQVVISGDRAGITDAQARATDVGAKKVVELKVSGAFHSPLMAPAAEGLAERLASTDFRDPAVPVVSNVTAEPIRSGDDARSLLVAQLTSPVRWSASIARMLADGAAGFAELGPGKVLCGLNRRNARGVPCSSLGTPDDIELYLAASEGGIHD